MTDRPRFYITTSIAYANSRPGLHTLFEVIAADAIARWHRMLGHDTYFLTGTDEYSVNIALAAQAQGKTPRQFVDEMVELFEAAEDALLIAPDRFIRTTDPDHVVAVHEMIRRAYASGDLYVDNYEGWYCPNEGFIPQTQLVEEGGVTRCTNHPTVDLQWLTERNWFFRQSAYQERLERYYAEHPEWVQPEFRKNEMLGFMAQGLEDFSVSREGAPWGIPFPIREDGSSAQLPDGSWDPAAGTVYVWFDALTNYITGVGFPTDEERFARWWPCDVHVIGKDINRLHTIMWPSMLMSAGIELPRLVFVHGWLLVPGGQRMSKSLGNFFEPLDVVAAFGGDGARYVTLREAAFDRDSDVSWDSFRRRYNADLAHDFGNLLNRTLNMTGRYLDGERPTPRPAEESPLGREWANIWHRFGKRIDGYLLHDALAALWEFVGAANRYVDSERPWELNKQASAGDEAAGQRLEAVLGDLLEACRLMGLAAAPFMPRAAERVMAQLGLDYPYGADGNGGPPLAELAAWGAAGGGGSIGRPEILFPRLETTED